MKPNQCNNTKQQKKKKREKQTEYVLVKKYSAVFLVKHEHG